MTFPDCGCDGMTCRCAPDISPAPHRAFDPRTKCDRCGSMSPLYEAWQACEYHGHICAACLPAHALECDEPALHGASDGQSCECDECGAERTRTERGEVVA